MHFNRCSTHASVGISLVSDDDLELIRYSIRCARLLSSGGIQRVIYLKQVLLAVRSNGLRSLSLLKYIVLVVVCLICRSIRNVCTELHIVLRYRLAKLAVEVILNFIAQVAALSEVCGIGVCLEYFSCSILHRRVMLVVLAGCHGIAIGIGPVGEYIAVSGFRLGTLGGAGGGGDGLGVKGYGAFGEGFGLVRYFYILVLLINIGNR